eukprot:Skav223205  [mRNA]  locus=scaffold2072:71599:87511:+ [translate_table: standard]
MSVQFQSQNFQHILRNSVLWCKKCDIDLNKRAGELTTDEVNKIVAVVARPKPLEFKIPAWMLNRPGIRVRGQHTKTTGRHRAFAAMEGGKKK